MSSRLEPALHGYTARPDVIANGGRLSQSTLSCGMLSELRMQLPAIICFGSSESTSLEPSLAAILAFYLQMRIRRPMTMISRRRSVDKSASELCY